MLPGDRIDRHKELSVILDVLDLLSSWHVHENACTPKELFMRYNWRCFAKEQKELETMGHVRLGKHATT